MRVLVCGGRWFTDENRIWAGLSNVAEMHGEITTIVHGGASGANSIAGEWARLNRAACERERAGRSRMQLAPAETGTFIDLSGHEIHVTNCGKEVITLNVELTKKVAP